MSGDEMDYYRLVRRTDPTYTYRNAIYEYVSENRELLYLADEWIRERDPDAEIFDWDTLGEILEGMDPLDVLKIGYFSPDIDWRDNWLRFDGYGHLASFSDGQREDELMAVVDRDDFCEDIVSGKIEIPAEMAEVIRIFTDGSDLSVSRNLAPRRETAGKTVRKTGTASAKKTAGKSAVPVAKKKPVRKAPVAKKKASAPGRKTAKACPAQKGVLGKIPTRCSVQARKGARR